MKHAPSVVIVTWQRSEHGYSSLRYETCSVSCHRDMTTVRCYSSLSHRCHRDNNGQSMVIHISCFNSKVWMHALSQLSSSHLNGQNMVIHPYVMKHAPSVVIASWQQSEHGFSSLRYETCSVSCHRLMTMDRAGKKHGPSVVIVSWRRSEHDYTSFR